MRLRLTTSARHYPQDQLRPHFSARHVRFGPHLIQHVSVKSIFHPNISAPTGFVCHINVTDNVKHGKFDTYV